MVSHITTFCFVGIEVREVDIQTHIVQGLPSFCIVGLPNKTIAESKERIRAAFSSIVLSLPTKRITVNLSPADLNKDGSHFDLPIALGLLVDLEIISQEELENYIAMEELSLDGKLTKVTGILPAAIKANSINKGIIYPAENSLEAAWSGNNDIYAANGLLEVLNHFTGKQKMLSPVLQEVRLHDERKLDLQDIRGQIIPNNPNYVLVIF